jgi:light-regulated signal transduction histidine kinase (bacteriophytochrome)
MEKQFLLEEKNNEILAQNEQLIEQQEELETQRNALALQNSTIEYKNRLLEDQQAHLQNLVEERTQELVKMNKQLMDKNQRFEQYGFVTSHNFRGPVATLLGLCEIFNKKDLTDPYNIQIIEKTKETTAKIDQMIRDLSLLLDQEKNLESLYKTVELEVVLANTKVLLKKEIDENHVTIKHDFSDLQAFSTVPAYINSIFYNLISNSIKFKKENVEPVIEIKSTSKGAYNYITFKDNGLGIDMTRHSDNIFHPFKRFATHVPGKGLGLYLVKTQIEAMHGEVQIESQEGEGTFFKLLLKKG